MNLLASKYNVREGKLSLMRPGAEGIEGNEKANKERKGVVGYGSGLVISADGLILTNKHVAGMGNAVMIKFTDGTQKTGEIVVLDDEQDLALIRVKSDTPMPFVKLSKNDNPADGALAIIMGYPAPTMLGFNVKTTSGSVATGSNAKETSDVTLDARVNPGNSGGPVYDQFGNVMAIIAQKTGTVEAMHMDSYGLAISNGRIRKFLAKNNITAETADAATSPLTIEQISAKNREATVCIIGVKN
jgi:S1-C subfamily serine protease